MNNNKYLYWCTFISVTGGLLFGLNMAGISGAVNSIRDLFMLSDSSIGMVVSSLTLGCLTGALVSGSLADKFGRKKTLITTACLFAVSAAGCAFAQSQVQLTMFRVIAGLGVGAVSVVSPMYISEIAPAKNRGMLVSYNQFAIVTGILLAYTADYFLIDITGGWRYMLGFPLLFSILFLIMLVTAFPESPRWLVARGKTADATKILHKLRQGDVSEEIQNIEASVHLEQKKEKVTYADLFRGKMGKVVLLGTLLAALQQITGINAVVNYAPVIFEQTGVGGNTALLQSMLVGLINFAFTIITLWLVDRLGRKTLLLWGTGGMTLSLAFLTYSFTGAGNGVGVLVSLLLYIAFFAASYSPVMWVVISEIYPNRVRGVAMSFSTAISWGCTFLTVQFSPWLLNEYGGVVLFCIFGIFSLLAFLFIKIFIPETKGKTLEQIEHEMGLKQ